MILFRHAQIYDGTGQKPFLCDVLVRNDRIAEVGQNLEVPEDTEILEADGKLLCPGFIDIHRHADAAIFREMGYDLQCYRPVDLFPRTAHCETVGLFTKQ